MATTNAEDVDTSKLDKKLVSEIIQWESEADAMLDEADSYRSQAAANIVKLLDKGATERQVAVAINKSDTHVHFAAIAWRTLQDDTGVSDFQTAYKMAKRPAAERQADPTGQNSQQEPETQIKPDKIPSWASQVRDLKALTAAMVDRANAKQIKELSKIGEKFLRDVLTKDQDLENEAQ